MKVREWSIKIVKCRNFASENTLGLGIASKNEMKLSNFEGRLSEKCIILTSQGYLLNGSKSIKTELIYGEGDILNFKYDPFYELLEIGKENGRKLTLSAPRQENLYAFVRLTYASDEVQVL